MSVKRPSIESDGSPAKRVRQDFSSQRHGSSIAPTALRTTDPTCGQSYAFPGLETDDGAEEIFYGPAEDGLEYLRMVRSEAKGVPNLLVAPKQAVTLSQDDSSGLNYGNDDDGAGTGASPTNAELFYSDGAFASVNLASTLPSATPKKRGLFECQAQSAHADALVKRFERQRRQLASGPPPIQKASLPPISGLPDPSTLLTLRAWRSMLFTLLPTPSILSSPEWDQQVILTGLRGVEKNLSPATLIEAGEEGRRVFGAWMWGLLARCRSVRDMDSEDVGLVRAVGKRAVREMANSRRNSGLKTRGLEVHDGATALSNTTDVAGNDEPVGEAALQDFENAPTAASTNSQHDADDSLASARARLLASLTSGNGTELEVNDRHDASIHHQGATSHFRRNEDPDSEIDVDTDDDDSPEDTHPPTSHPKHAAEDMALLTPIYETLILIIALRYGQRDLLESVPPW